MAQIHHFDHGWVTPAVSYVLSVLGSLLGLTLAVKFRSARSSTERTLWLILAALAIGGTAIWSMHFVAMMGFDVDGTPIRYDVGLTAASAVIAVVAVGIGLAIALFGQSGQNTRILTGGVIAGLGVAAMHYTGMAAMRLNGDISYGITRVGMSIGIAVVAASVALWLAVTVRKPAVIFASALVMGVAVNGMHFTGMSAMSVRTEPSVGQLAGATAVDMLVPIGLAVLFGLLGLAYALMAAPTEEDRAAAAYLAARREQGATTGTIPMPRQPVTAQRPGPHGAEQRGPFGGGQRGPYGAEQRNPVGGGQLDPYGGEQRNPTGGGQRGPYGAEQRNPIGGGQLDPYGGEQRIPNGGGQPGPAGRPTRGDMPQRSGLAGGTWTYRDRSRWADSSDATSGQPGERRP